MQALPIYDKLALTIDIGGGSTEIVVGQEARPFFTASMRLGSQRLQARLLSPFPLPALPQGKLSTQCDVASPFALLPAPGFP